MEFVVAAALVMTLLGSVLTLVDPTRSSLRVQPQAAEMHQRMRAAFARIHADLMMAGSGPNLPSAATGASVASLRAPLVPHRIGHRYQRSVGRQFARDAISVLYAPPQTAGATLASSLVSSTQDVRLVSAAPCRSSTATCGLDADTLALVFDEDGRSDVVRVTRVLRNIVSLERVGAGLPAAAFGPALAQRAVQATLVRARIDSPATVTDGIGPVATPGPGRVSLRSWRLVR